MEKQENERISYKCHRPSNVHHLKSFKKNKYSTSDDVILNKIQTKTLLILCRRRG